MKTWEICTLKAEWVVLPPVYCCATNADVVAGMTILGCNCNLSQIVHMRCVLPHPALPSMNNSSWYLIFKQSKIWCIVHHQAPVFLEPPRPPVDHNACPILLIHVQPLMMWYELELVSYNPTWPIHHPVSIFCSVLFLLYQWLSQVVMDVGNQNNNNDHHFGPIVNSICSFHLCQKDAYATWTVWLNLHQQQDQESWEIKQGQSCSVMSKWPWIL